MTASRAALRLRTVEPVQIRVQSGAVGVDAACREALFTHPDDSLLEFSFCGIFVDQPVKCLAVPPNTALTEGCGDSGVL